MTKSMHNSFESISEQWLQDWQDKFWSAVLFIVIMIWNITIIKLWTEMIIYFVWLLGRLLWHAQNSKIIGSLTVSLRFLSQRHTIWN